MHNIAHSSTNMLNDLEIVLLPCRQYPTCKQPSSGSHQTKKKFILQLLSLSRKSFRSNKESYMLQHALQLCKKPLLALILHKHLNKSKYPPDIFKTTVRIFMKFSVLNYMCIKTKMWKLVCNRISHTRVKSCKTC